VSGPFETTPPRRARTRPEIRMPLVLTTILSIVFFPITLLGSWIVVSPQEEVVLLRWGRFSRLMREPGLSWVTLWGRRAIRISTKQQAIEVHRTVVADGNGNPILAAAVVTFRFVDTRRAALDVEDAPAFVRTQAMAVLKQVASRYPYESATHATSLKSETAVIAGEMREILQSKVQVAGAEVVSFELSDLSYAPEIARAMLVRQQAQALVDARKVIVEGAVEIVDHAIALLREKGHRMQPTEQERLVSNLLLVICGESHVQPTVSVQGGDHRDASEEGRLRELLETIAKNTADPAS
jgi:regulator of protease activity HflC (stomatin/prohibitin superfamily)